MFDIPIRIKVGYNRERDINKDYFKTIIVMTTSREMAISKINDYSVKGMFDSLEGDYIEDSLYVVE